MRFLLPDAVVPEILGVETRAMAGAEVTATAVAGPRVGRREVERDPVRPPPDLLRPDLVRDQAAQAQVPHVPIPDRRGRISPQDAPIQVGRAQVVHLLVAPTSAWEGIIVLKVAAIVLIPAGADGPMWGEGTLTIIMGRAVDRTLAPNQESSRGIVQGTVEITGLEMAMVDTQDPETVGQILLITHDREVGGIPIRDMGRVQDQVRAECPAGLGAIDRVGDMGTAQVMITVQDMAPVIIRGVGIDQIPRIILRTSIITTIMRQDGTIIIITGTMAIGGAANGAAPQDGELGIALDIVRVIGTAMPVDRGIAPGTPMRQYGALAAGRWGLLSMILAMPFTATPTT